MLIFVILTAVHSGYYQNCVAVCDTIDGLLNPYIFQHMVTYSLTEAINKLLAKFR